jgi:hypothetical protein
MSKPALTIEPNFRSGLEKKVADQLEAQGVAYQHEAKWVRYIVPSREAKYLPDFCFDDCPILIEAKGRFGGGNPKFKQPATDGAKERQKLILLKEQHPDLDIRIVFQRAATPIYPGSKTTYAKWAADHGFRFSDKGVVPAEWIEDIKQFYKQRK